MADGRSRMTAEQARAILGTAVGTLERVSAHLSRVEHGVGREMITRARADLSEQAAALLILRARLSASQDGPTAEAGR